jgi:acetyl-CoA carboxylase carboxyl transferase subunit beta
MTTWPDKKAPDLDATEKRSLGKGVFQRCDGCGETVPTEAMFASFEVCPHCGQHHKLAAPRWRDLLLDDGRLEEWDAHLAPADPLHFTDGKSYVDRIASAQKSSKATEAVEIGRARMEGKTVAYGAFLFAFMGGSMGSVVGEKVTRLFERATDERLRDAGLPFLSVLLHPTTGGVAASFALLGDVNLAEPKALIGFAGARVIEQTIRQTLPEGFQRSEFLLAHGMIDRIVSRLEMKSEIARLVGHFMPVR